MTDDTEEDKAPLKNMKHGYTNRGFVLYEFEDRYGEKCSLQEFSLAGEGAIWFGTEGKIDQGPPWKEYKLPDNCLVHSRMHLTVDQVEKLIPILQHFVETSYLPQPEKEEKDGKE